MTVEQLTDDDREYLADCNHRDRGPKALRIIDRDAATLARVRAVRDMCEAAGVDTVAGALDCALAGSPAAPEAGCADRQFPERTEAEKVRDAAVDQLRSRLATANARADEAEREMKVLRADLADSIRSYDGALLTCGQLRSEFEAVDASHRFVLNQHNAAQDESAVLRAEVEHWAAEASAFDGQRMAAESRLAAANALLVRLRDTPAGRRNAWLAALREDVRLHLAAQPATAPDEGAE